RAGRRGGERAGRSRRPMGARLGGGRGGGGGWAAPPGGHRSSRYFLGSGGAMVSCLTILLSPHFPGSSLSTVSTKYCALRRSPVGLKAMSPVMPESLALRTAAATSSPGSLPFFAVSSLALTAVVAASLASAALGSGVLANFF